MKQCKCGREKAKRHSACPNCWSKMTVSEKSILKIVASNGQSTLRQYRKA